MLFYCLICPSLNSTFLIYEVKSQEKSLYVLTKQKVRFDTFISSVFILLLIVDTILEDMLPKATLNEMITATFLWSSIYLLPLRLCFGGDVVPCPGDGTLYRDLFFLCNLNMYKKLDCHD